MAKARVTSSLQLGLWLLSFLYSPWSIRKRLVHYYVELCLLEIDTNPRVPFFGATRALVALWPRRKLWSYKTYDREKTAKKKGLSKRCISVIATS